MVVFTKEMNSVLGHNSALYGYTGPGTTLANEMNLLWIMPQVQDRSLDIQLQSKTQMFDCERGINEFALLVFEYIILKWE